VVDASTLQTNNNEQSGLTRKEIFSREDFLHFLRISHIEQGLDDTFKSPKSALFSAYMGI